MNAFNYLRSVIRQKITEAPIDYSESQAQEWTARLKGTIMPPSPGVDAYKALYSYDISANILDYELHVKWKPIVEELVRRMPQWQVTHRGRSAVIAFSPLRAAEQHKKIVQIRDWEQGLKKYNLSDRSSVELFNAFLDYKRSYMTVDMEYISKYVRDHETSSLGGGVKWRDLAWMGKSEWTDIYNDVLAHMDDVQAHPGGWSNVQWNIGLRARSGALPAFTDIYRGEIDRTRIVSFHPSFSIHNVFITDKPKYYADVLSFTEDLVDARPRFHYPSVEGGQIYQTANELFHSSRDFSAYDGKNWEASVGSLLGQAFHPLLSYVEGLPFLPSGSSDTTILGTCANIIQNRNVDADIIALSDDCNMFNLKGYTSVPWVELDDGDTTHKVILGASFGVDIDAPRVTGLKAMSDRAKKALPLRLETSTLEGETAAFSKRSLEETATWAGLYMGYYGDRTLLEALKDKRIEHRDYFSPSQLVEEMISDGSNNRFDAFAWAEELGIKKILTV